MSAADTNHTFKIFITGPDGVGKKTFAHRANIRAEDFDASHETTEEDIVAANDSPVEFDVGVHKVKFTFDLEDHADADAMMLCFDVSDADSFANCRDSWTTVAERTVQAHANRATPHKLPVMVMGLKSDLGVATERPACNAAFEDTFGWEYIQFSVISEHTVLAAVQQILAREIMGHMYAHRVDIEKVTLRPAPDFDGEGKGSDCYVIIKVDGSKKFKSEVHSVVGTEIAVLAVDTVVPLEGNTITFVFKDEDVLKDDSMFTIETTPEDFNARARAQLVTYARDELTLAKPDPEFKKIPENFEVCFNLRDFRC